MVTPDYSNDRFVNMTNHPLHVYENARLVRQIPATKRAVRVQWIEHGEFRVAGLPVERISHGAIEIPPAEPGVWFVVSQVMKLAMMVHGVDRLDVLIPGPGVSDCGRVVGVRGLVLLVPSGSNG